MENEEMTIDEFLFDSGMKQHQLAAMIGCTPTHLSSIKNGKAKPSKRIIYVLDKITKGRVKLKRDE